MPTYPLAYRITQFLNRQIDWSRTALEELETFTNAPGDADIEPMLAVQQARERETRDMAREYRGLAREWADAHDMDPDDVAAIKRLSGEAQVLVEQLRQAYAHADAAAEAKRASNRRAANDLRRGRRSVNIYRPGDLVSPGFIDKKA